MIRRKTESGKRMMEVFRVCGPYIFKKFSGGAFSMRRRENGASGLVVFGLSIGKPATSSIF
jgi:hypothetical protein